MASRHCQAADVETDWRLSHECFCSAKPISPHGRHSSTTHFEERRQRGRWPSNIIASIFRHGPIDLVAHDIHTCLSSTSKTMTKAIIEKFACALTHRKEVCVD